MVAQRVLGAVRIPRLDGIDQSLMLAHDAVDADIGQIKAAQPVEMADIGLQD